MIRLKSFLKEGTKSILSLLVLGIILFGRPQLVWSQRRGPVECDLPPMDIPGEDLPDFPRFPGSIRVQYVGNTERFSFIESTRVKGILCQFLSASDMKELMEFHSKSLIAKGWKIISSQYLTNDKAVLSLEKKPNRIMLTLEPKMQSVPSRTGGQSKMQVVKSKCYQTSAFFYKIPPEIPRELDQLQ